MQVPPLIGITATEFLNLSVESTGFQQELSLHLSVAAQQEYEENIRQHGTHSQKALYAGISAPYAPIPIVNCEFKGICAITNPEFHTWNLIRTGTSPIPGMHTCPMCNMHINADNINHWLSCNFSASGRTILHHDIKRVLVQAATKANQGRVVNEPPHLFIDTASGSGSNRRPDFAIYGGIDDTVCGQTFDFSIVIPTAVSIVTQMQSSISQPRGTIGLIPTLESVKIVEKRKNNHYRDLARNIKFSFTPLVMEATGGMSRTLRKYLRDWTQEHSTSAVSSTTRDLVKQVSYTLLRGQTTMLTAWLGKVNAIRMGRLQKGIHSRGGSNSPLRSSRP